MTCSWPPGHTSRSAHTSAAGGWRQASTAAPGHTSSDAHSPEARTPLQAAAGRQRRPARAGTPEPAAAGHGAPLPARGGCADWLRAARPSAAAGERAAGAAAADMAAALSWGAAGGRWGFRALLKVRVVLSGGQADRPRAAGGLVSRFVSFPCAVLGGRSPGRLRVAPCGKLGRIPHLPEGLRVRSLGERCPLCVGPGGVSSLPGRAAEGSVAV